MSDLFRALVPDAPANRRVEGDPDRGDRFLTRAKVASFFTKKAFAPGLASPSLVSSQTGKIDKLLFAFPPFAVSEPAYVAAYQSVIRAMRAGTEFIVAATEADQPTILSWFTSAGHARDKVTFATMPDYARFTDWAEDAYVSMTDAADGAHYLMEPWEFLRAGDALIADQVEEYADIRASQAPLIFQGGNVLIADDHWFLGRDYLADSIDLATDQRGPVPVTQGQDPEEFVRRLFADRVESRRELVVVGSARPLPLRDYVGRKDGSRYVLDIVSEGAGTYQPIFHIDMLLSLAGRSDSGRQRVLVGDPGIAERILGVAMPYALRPVYDVIADELSQRGFEVIRNPLVHWPTEGAARSLRELKAISQQAGNDALRPAIRELENAGAQPDAQVTIVSWHHITWNNCLVEISTDVGRHVYLPTFGHGTYASLQAVDDHMRDLWTDLGFTPAMLGDFNAFAERLGVVHCIKKYLRRGA